MFQNFFQTLDSYSSNSYSLVVPNDLRHKVLQDVFSNSDLRDKVLQKMYSRIINKEVHPQSFL